jgi:FkbM family methyltransferase
MNIFSVFFFIVCVAAKVCAYDILVETTATQSLGYGDWYIHTDGELDLMREILRPGDTVFDIGAHMGDWSAYALAVEESISLYSFEPIPSTFSGLKNRLTEYPNAHCFCLALSNTTGRGQFCHYDESESFAGLSTFYAREVLKIGHQPPKVIEIEQDTVAHFCVEKGIEKIDFLKIDAEGAEWIILLGAERLLKDNRIGAVQFEYGGCFVDAKTTLKEIFTLFFSHEYLLFRIIPNGLISIPIWQDTLENFDMSNYLAIKKEMFLSRINYNG